MGLAAPVQGMDGDGRSGGAVQRMDGDGHRPGMEAWETAWGWKE